MLHSLPKRGQQRLLVWLLLLVLPTVVHAQLLSYSYSTPNTFVKENLANGNRLANVIKPTFFGRGYTSAAISAGTRPVWMGFNAQTGEFTVADASRIVIGAYSFRVDLKRNDTLVAEDLLALITVSQQDGYTVNPARNVDAYGMGDALALQPANKPIQSAVLLRGNSLPPGVALNAANGDLTVSDPTKLVAGSYSFNVTVTPVGGRATTTALTIHFTRDQEATYVAPTRFNKSALQTGQLLTLPTDADGLVKEARITQGAQPNWLTFVASGIGSGAFLLNGAVNPPAGDYKFTVHTTDATGGQSDVAVTLTFFNDQPAVYSVSAARNVDSYQNGDVLATVKDADGALVSARLAAGSTMPGFVKLDTVSGKLSALVGPALRAGTYTFSIVTRDATGGTSTTPVTLVIKPDLEAAYSTPNRFNADWASVNGSTLATVKDPDGAIRTATLPIASQLLKPGWMAVDAVTGRVSVSDATGVRAGTWTFTVNTTDQTGGKSAMPVTIVIYDDIEAVYSIVSPRNLDVYTNGNVLGIVTDPDGAITDALLTKGSLPAGVALNATTGKLTVSDRTKLVPGTYNFEVSTVDATGGISFSPITLAFLADREAAYSTPNRYSKGGVINGKVLATVRDADGRITSASVATGSTVPTWMALNPKNGEVTVKTAASAVAGMFSFTVNTVDSTGGRSAAAVRIEIIVDKPAVWSIWLPKNVDAYKNGQELGKVTDPDGAVVSAVLAGGTSLPAGVKMDSLTGRLTVKDRTKLVAGEHPFKVKTTDDTGGETTSPVKITIGVDRKAEYSVPAPLNQDLARNGRLLAAVTDPDGIIVHATLLAGPLPGGVVLDSLNGNLLVADSASVVPGNWSLVVATTDSSGGESADSVQVVFLADQEAAYTVLLAEDLDFYEDGDTLALVSDPDGPVTGAAVAPGSALPPGVALDPGNGRLTVEAAHALMAGNYDFTITAFGITAGRSDLRVEIGLPADREAVYSYPNRYDRRTLASGQVVATATDPDGPIQRAGITQGVRPAWLGFSSLDGSFYVLDPAVAAVGAYEFTVETRDLNGGRSRVPVQIVIVDNDQPAIYGVNNPKNVDAYAAGEELATVMDPDGPVVSAALANSTTLPSGVALNPTTGKVTVMNPAALLAGTHSFDVKTTDAQGGTTTSTVEVEFLADQEAAYSVSPPRHVGSYQAGESLATVSDPDGAIVSAQINANGPALPQGMALNPVTGEITVSDPAALRAMPYAFDVTTTDATGGQTTQTVQLSFLPDQPSSYTVSSPRNVDSYIVGSELAFAADPDGAIVEAQLSPGFPLPAGVVITPDGTIFVQAPAQLVAGSYDVRVTTVDVFGGTTYHALTIVIGPDLEAAYSAPNRYNIDDVDLYGHLLAWVTDGDGPIVQAQVIGGNQPFWLGVDPVNGNVMTNGPGITPGLYTFTVETRDNTGGRSLAPCGIEIVADQEARAYILSPRNVDALRTGQLLGGFLDDDGLVVGVTLTGSVLPPGVVLYPANQINVGDDALLVPGTYTFSVETRDETGGRSNVNVTLTILPDQEAAYSAPNRFCEGALHYGMVLATVSDPDGRITWVSEVGGAQLNNWYGVNNLTGEIVVNSTSVQPGVYPIQLNTEDETGGKSTVTATIEILRDQMAVYSVAPARNVDSYRAGGVLAMVSDPDGAIVQAWVDSRFPLPTGVALDPVSGQLTVTNPAQLVPGQYEVWVMTKDPRGCESFHPLTLTFLPDQEAAYSAPNRYRIDELQNQTVLASVLDPDGLLASAQVTQGFLPGWLYFSNTTGAFELTDPSGVQAGTYTFTVHTEDQTGGQSDVVVTIEILPDQEASYSIAPAYELSALVNGLSLASAQDPDGPIVLAQLLVGGLPGWMSFSPTTGEFTVSDAGAAGAGSYMFEVKTTDLQGGISDLTVTILIEDHDQEAIVSGPTRYNQDAVDPGMTVVTLVDPDGPIVSATLLSGLLPAWLSFDAATGAFSVTGSAAVVPGLLTFTVETRDIQGGRSTVTVTLDIFPDQEASFTLRWTDTLGVVHNCPEPCGETITSLMAGPGGIGALIEGQSLDMDGIFASARLEYQFNLLDLQWEIANPHVPGFLSNAQVLHFLDSIALELQGLPDLPCDTCSTFKLHLEDETGGETDIRFHLIGLVDPVYHLKYSPPYYTSPNRFNQDAISNQDTLARLLPRFSGVTVWGTEIVQGVLPDWMTFEPETGQFGVNDPAAIVPGTYTFVVKANCSLNFAPGLRQEHLVDVTITVFEHEASYTVNPPQVVSSYANGDFLATVSDVDGSIVSAQLALGSSLPPGVVISANDGYFYIGDATALVAGSYTLQVMTTDATGGQTTSLITLTFEEVEDQEASYSVQPAQPVRLYQANQSLASVTDPDCAITSALLILGPLPNGVALNGTSGELTVSDPTQLRPGTYSFTVQTTDCNGGTTDHTVTLTFENGDREALYPTVNRFRVDSLSNGQSLAIPHDPDDPLVSAQITSGLLPAWMSFNTTTGEFTINDASAAVPGTYSFTVHTADPYGGESDPSVTIEIKPAPEDQEASYSVAPALPTDDYMVGQILATVHDPDGPITSAVLTSGILPGGVSLDPATGELTVSDSTLLVAGGYTFGILTTDSRGGTTDHLLLIGFNDSDSIPDQEAAYSAPNVFNQDALSYTTVLASVSDPDGAIVAAAIHAGMLPGWMSFDSGNGAFGISDVLGVQPGHYSFTVVTTDALGGESFPMAGIEIVPDQEATYLVLPAFNVDAYHNGQVLGNAFELDGDLTSVTLGVGSMLPPGVALNGVNGQLTVSDSSALVAGTYPLTLLTTDDKGGQTTLTIEVVINPDQEASYSSPNRFAIDYLRSFGPMTIVPLATASDPDGSFFRARIVAGTKPGWMGFIDGGALAGQFFIVDAASDVQAGTYTFTVETRDMTDGRSRISVTIEIVPDQEASYTVAPSQPVGNYGFNQSLATATDPDGAITSARLRNGAMLPPGVGFSTTTGEFYVTNPAQLVAGSYPVEVETVDTNGGSTDHTVALTFEADTAGGFNRVMGLANPAAAPVLTLYPNPVVEVLHLDLTALPAGEVSLMVTDAQGRTVLVARQPAGQLGTLDLRALPTGTYLVRAVGPAGWQATRWLLKQ